MNAVTLVKPAGFENVRLVKSLPRAPGPGELLVRVRASSLNYHDYVVVVGRRPTQDGRVPMSDGAGEVIEAAPGTPFAPGDRVMSLFFPGWQDGPTAPEDMRSVPGDGVDGFASEYVTMPASAFTRIPKGYSDLEAATLPCAAVTAWRGLFVNGHLRCGDVVLIQGTGGVSTFALQFAKAAGATVIATTSSAEKASRLKELGADYVINHRLDKEWGNTARQLTGGRGVDHVIEIGGAGTLPQSILACRPGAHIALIGAVAGYAGELQTVTLITKQVRLIGFTVGSRRDQEDMIRGIEAIGLHPVIDAVFPLEQIANGFRHQQSGQHFGKICLQI